MPRGAYHLREEEEYLALGLEVWRGVVWVDISENDRTVSSVPLLLFEVVDGQVSGYWELRTTNDGGFRLWPSLFYERAFHDRLSNGDPELLRQFLELRRLMEAEAR